MGHDLDLSLDVIIPWSHDSSVTNGDYDALTDGNLAACVTMTQMSCGVGMKVFISQIINTVYSNPQVVKPCVYGVQNSIFTIYIMYLNIL